MTGQEGIKLGLSVTKFYCVGLPCNLYHQIFKKFAEQYGDIIQWNQSNRVYILTHGVCGVDWSHYKQPPLPEYVYANYMQYWGSVHLLEKELPREITRTDGFKVAQPRAGLSRV